MKYRRLRLGEIIRPSDQYLSWVSHRWKRADSSFDFPDLVGDPVSHCHCPYRRPLKTGEADKRHTTKRKCHSCK